ncbi:Gfo/Idh/MocA family protein [Aquihabitans sp. McL0605]|uniref:Gfo/Idh/MocA family protein n=1 Tax=Aquihabitans sp. McL0605 TaxID=3415671 RepID=UPI003CFAE8A2
MTDDGVLIGRRVAIVGCGGAGRLHAEALTRAGLAPAVLIDPHAGRRSDLARSFPDAALGAEVGPALDAFDAAVVAVPDELHAPLAIELLAAGKDVLVDKPIAGTRAEAEAMAAAAAAAGRALAVGHVRRHLPVLGSTAALLRSGSLGKVLRVDAAHGGRDDWIATSSGYVVGAAGGVIANQGAHTIDVLAWWFGPLEVVSCVDDGHGGQEADATIELLAGDVPLHLQLSRIRSLRNTIRVHTERGLVEVALDHYQPAQVVSLPDGVDPALLHDDPLDLPDQFDRQLVAWSEALDGRWPPTLATPAQGIVVAALIEACHRVRTTDEPWWMTSAARS